MDWKDWKDLTEEQGRHWAAAVRRNYRAGQLSPEIVAACESIKNWSWERKKGGEYPSYAEARAFAQSLGLKGQREWFAYCKSGAKPANIPANPYGAYRKNGWVSWTDWLGLESFLPFADARAFVHTLGLKTYDEWRVYRKSEKKPTNIPGGPNKVYANKGWSGYSDWLGTNRSRLCTKARPFNEARAFVHALNLKNSADWIAYCKSGNRPTNVPAAPNRTYTDTGWISWGDWFGTGIVADRKKVFLSWLSVKWRSGVLR